MSEGEERRRRPDPVRYGPNRNFSGAFRSDTWSQREDLFRERFGDDTERRNGSENGDRPNRRMGTGAASEGVRVGYDICEEQMRDGWRAAENYNGGHREEDMRDYRDSYSGESYGPSYSRRGYEAAGRIRAGYPDLVPILTEYLTALCATVYPGLHPYHHYHHSHRGWGPPPPQSPFYPSGPGEYDRRRVRVRLISNDYRSAQATLHLEHYRPSMVLNPLRHQQPTETATLSGYAETVDGHTTLHVEIDDEPAGTYSGLIVDGDYPDKQLGTLTVRLFATPSEPDAKTARKKAK